jgi:hypothetical protein
LAKQVAMTAMAPKSSTVARVSKNADTAAGNLPANAPNTPMANAMSVALKEKRQTQSNQYRMRRLFLL